MSKSVSFLVLGMLLGLGVGSVVFMAILRGQADDVGPRGVRVLKLAHVLDQSHPVHAGMAYMAERLNELSDGRMRIEIFPNGQLGSEPESIEQLQRGALAMVKTSTAAMEGFVPEMAVFGFPYLFRDEEHYWNVLNGEIGTLLLRAGERVGIHGLNYYDSGSRSFYTVSKPILTPEDVRGLKIRTLPSRMALELISTLGGSPTPVPWGELYTALQQGMVDGAENNPPSLLTSRHYEVAKHYSLDQHTRIPDMVIFSKRIWDSLSPQEQEWLDEAAADSVDSQRDLWKRETERALEELEANGVTIYTVDQNAFAEAAAPFYEEFGASPAAALAEQIQAVP